MFSRLGPNGAVLLALSLLAGGVRPDAQSAPSESQIKAAFVYRFTDYIEWPDAALAGRKAIELCVVRPSPVSSDLAALVAGQMLDGREFLVRDVVVDDPLSTCHLLFIPASASRQGRAFVQKVLNQPVLTVGDYEAFLSEGGTIGLKVVDGRVRFEVSLAAARRANLRLGSQLLRLALRVR